jgi:hypothetical protein
MHCEVLAVDDRAEGETHEEIDEVLVHARGVLRLTCLSHGLHSLLKLKEVVITRPSWFPRSRYTARG